MITYWEKIVTSVMENGTKEWFSGIKKMKIKEFGIKGYNKRNYYLYLCSLKQSFETKRAT